MGGEILFVIPAVLAFAAVATLGGTLLVWLLWVLARRWGRAKRVVPPRFPIRGTAAVLLAISLPAGCIFAVPKAEILRTVAAFEVPLTSAQDKDDFLTLLTAVAKAEGLEVHADTAEEMQQWAQMSPELRASLSAAAYRGGDLRQPEAHVSDMFHPGFVWLSFTEGKDPALARRFREGLMSRILARWPETMTVPVAQTGALPHRRDLVRGDQGYEIDPAKMAVYICGTAPDNAPLSACD